MTEPQSTSRIPVWGARIALILLLIIPLAVASVRYEWAHYSWGLLAFAAACFGSLLVMILLLVALVLPQYKHCRATTGMGILTSLPAVVMILIIVTGAQGYPQIHHATTDLEDPPEPAVAQMLRGESANPLAMSDEVKRIQRQSYPDLKTIVTTLSPDRAFVRAEKVADTLGWDIYNSDPRAGVIEASITSSWFGFTDDVIVRVRSTDTGSEIDLLSVSRVGLGDLGANAERVRAFMQDYLKR